MNDSLSFEEIKYRLRILENEARWRKQAEVALKESEERFKLLFEYAPDMFFLCDPNGILIDANRAAEKLTGYDRHEVVGKSLLSTGILPESQIEKAVELLYKISSKIPTDPEEITITKKDGSRLNVELRAYPVELGGRPVVLTTARDVDAHKEAIQLLSQREEIFRRFFETAPEPLILFDVQTGRIEDVNQAFCVLLGSTQDELTGIGFQELLKASGNEPQRLPGYNNGKIKGPAEISCIFRKKSNSTIKAKIRFRAFSISDRHLIVATVTAKIKDA